MYTVISFVVARLKTGKQSDSHSGAVLNTYSPVRSIGVAVINRGVSTRLDRLAAVNADFNCSYTCTTYG